MQFPNATILIFTKLPRPGKVKTRLIPVLGAEGAAALAAQLLERTLEQAAVPELAPLECWVAPACQGGQVGRLQARFGFTCHPQGPGDLGQRMSQALADVLGRSEMAVLIGGDCPVLESRHLVQALAWLEQGADAVLGPAEDGGYVLLGLRRAEPSLFEELAWGTGGVLSETRARLQKLGWDWRELETLWDLDRPSDLARFNARE